MHASPCLLAIRMLVAVLKRLCDILLAFPTRANQIIRPISYSVQNTSDGGITYAFGF